jgi:putative SOS response-associated peptidase YedK
MCGQYVFTLPVEAMQHSLPVQGAANVPVNYNVAPTHDMPIVRVAR